MPWGKSKLAKAYTAGDRMALLCAKAGIGLELRSLEGGGLIREIAGIRLGGMICPLCHRLAVWIFPHRLAGVSKTRQRAANRPAIPKTALLPNRRSLIQRYAQEACAKAQLVNLARFFA